MYNYTIIVPHKNCPILLQRALNSIPLNDDIQVIIIDDNSDPTIVDFENFPGLKRKNTIVVFDKSGKGAGRARNIGLSKIENNTKWVAFLDADDFYSKDVNSIFDKYKDSKSDIIYFHCNSVFSETLEASQRHISRNKKLEKGKFDNDLIRYKDYVPWAKFISYNIISSNSLEFEEIYVGNDTMFSVRLGTCCKIIEVANEVLYVVTVRKNSLVQQKNFDTLNSRYETAKRVNKYLKEHNKLKYRVNMFALAYKFKGLGISMMIKYILKAFKDTSFQFIFPDLWVCFIAFCKKEQDNLN